MMTKKQKTWLWISLAMFALPEILFFTIISSIINYSGKDFLTLISPFVDSRFFINNPVYFFVFSIIEWIGILGLAIVSIKLNKKLLSIMLIIIILWMSLVLFLGYVSSNISPIL